jgi:hypothetical protein
MSVPVMVDVRDEIRRVGIDLDILGRKLSRLEEETDAENIDSHVIAIGLTIERAYGGLEKALKTLLGELDGEVPFGPDSHRRLLRRALLENPGVRSRLISEDTYQLLDVLRGYRHRFRNLYKYQIKQEKVLEMVEVVRDCFEKFQRDMSALERSLGSGEPAGS